MIVSTLLAAACVEEPVDETAQLRAGPLSCELHELGVALVPGDPSTYTVVGELCWRGELADAHAAQVLVHGATYDRRYWNWKGHGYVRQATKRGFATFAYDRLGNGESDKPPGALVDIDGSAYVNAQVVAALRDGELGPGFSTVVQVGHSFGSLISLAAAATHGDVDALVLTGFAHQVTQQSIDLTNASVYPAVFDPQFLDLDDDPANPTYFTTLPGARETLFFSSLVTPNTLVADEAAKDLFQLGLVLDIPRHLSLESQAISAPVLMVLGDQDALYCGEQIDCSDPASFADHEAAFFSAPVETRLVTDTGHSLALHKQAKNTDNSIQDWLAATL